MALPNARGHCHPRHQILISKVTNKWLSTSGLKEILKPFESPRATTNRLNLALSLQVRSGGPRLHGWQMFWFNVHAFWKSYTEP